MLLVALVAVLGVAVAGYGSRPERDGHRRAVGYGQIRFDGAGPERWAQRARTARRELAELRARARHELTQARRQLRRERRVLLASTNVVEAINLAAATYGYGPTLWRKARCETGGTFDPNAQNGSSGAAGLFQFLPSTFASTPYAGFSVFSPYANALAAGWMHANGRGSEWSCQ